ncbi:hypothetical protein F0U62_08815 [Cystobacter fuscus]|nr:hypothetical protein F0U62_08815 [Cystobacter fuscus]
MGEYRNVAGLRIDPTKVGSAHIFRPWGWTVVLIVSERVKLAMEEEGLTGARFIEVRLGAFRSLVKTCPKGTHLLMAGQVCSSGSRGPGPQIV